MENLKIQNMNIAYQGQSAIKMQVACVSAEQINRDRGTKWSREINLIERDHGLDAVKYWSSQSLR